MLALSPKDVFLFVDDAMAPGFAQAQARSAFDAAGLARAVAGHQNRGNRIFQRDGWRRSVKR
jgi:hypothetical protein